MLELATLRELQTVYTLDDLVDFHTAIAFKSDMQEANKVEANP